MRRKASAFAGAFLVFVLIFVGVIGAMSELKSVGLCWVALARATVHWVIWGCDGIGSDLDLREE